MNENYDSGASTLPNYATLIWSKKVPIALFVLLCLGLSYWLVKNVTPLYTAEASVALKNRRTPSMLEDTPNLVLPQIGAASVRTEADILQSRALAEKVATQLNLFQDPEFNPDLEEPSLLSTVEDTVQSGVAWAGRHVADLGIPVPASLLKDPATTDVRTAVIDNVMERLSTSSAADAYTIRVRFTSESPEKAAKVANSLVDTYMQEQVNSRFSEARVAMNWLEQRIGELRKELDEANNAISDFRQQNGLVATADGNPGLLAAQQLVGLNTEIGTLRAQRSEIEAKLKEARQLSRSGRAESLGFVGLDPSIQLLRQQEATLNNEYANLSSTLGEQHPEIQRLKAQIAGVQRERAAQVGNIIRGLESQMTEIAAREQSIAKTIDDLRNEANTTGRFADELTQLQRIADSKATMLQGLEERYKEASSRLKVEETDARIVAHAGMPAQPSYPNTAMFMLVAFVGSTLFATTMTVLFDRLAPGFRTVHEVRRELGLPVLATLPLVKAGRDEQISDHIVKNPLEPFAEAIRSVVAALPPGNPHAGPKQIVVTSTVPDEGKTTAAVSLARTLAMSGCSTLLVDCDLRRPSVAQMLRLRDGRGLAEAVEADEAPDDFVQVDAASGLHVLPAGHSIQNPQRFLGRASRSGAALKRLMSDYEVVVFDTPPVMVASDAGLIGKGADAMLFVVEWEKTPRSAVKAALDSLSLAGTPVTGVLLSKVDVRKQRYAGDISTYAYRYKDYYRPKTV